VLGAGEAREIRANLGDEHLGGAPGDAGDGLQERHGLLLSGQARCELGIQTHNSRIQGVQVGELLTRTEKTWCACSRPTTAWASASRLARSLPRASSASACASVSPSSSRCRISRAQEAAHLGDDRGQLDVGVFQHRLQLP
jgi:hypothetical protein